MAANCFGIDIGTRSTVIYRYNPKLKTSAPFKIAGNAVIPTSYLLLDDGNYITGQDAEDLVRREPKIASRLYKGFKIDYWVPEDHKGQEKKARDELLGFVKLIWKFLVVEFKGELSKAAFCFTYPAQRNDRLADFEKLVREAGFPDDRIHFLDEPSAASCGFAWSSVATEEGPSSRGAPFWKRILSPLAAFGEDRKSSFDGTGLIIDIGAGTTDVAVVELGESKLKIAATRSTNCAGNDCTLGLATLAKHFGKNASEAPAEAWCNYVSEHPSQADLYKEQDFSDFYRDPDNEDMNTNRRIARYGIELESDSLDAFAKSSASCWEAIRDSVRRVLNDAGRSEKRIGWVLLVGGGARHSALQMALEQEYGQVVKVADDPQTLVAQGAMFYAGQKSGAIVHESKGVKLTSIVHEVEERVAIKFPDDTEAGSVVLLKRGQEIDLKEDNIDIVKSVTLQSNVVSSEGPAYLVVGEDCTPLGVVDIEWKLFGESNNHVAKIHAILDPGSRELKVKLSLQNVKLIEQVKGSAEVCLKTKGGFDHV